MQRAMQTTVNMFKEHPNKHNIKFVVLPMVREALRSINGIAINCYDMMAKFGEGQKIAGGLKFDFSYLLSYENPELWQVYTLCNNQL